MEAEVGRSHSSSGRDRRATIEVLVELLDPPEQGAGTDAHRRHLGHEVCGGNEELGPLRELVAADAQDVASLSLAVG